MRIGGRTSVVGVSFGVILAVVAVGIVSAPLAGANRGKGSPDIIQLSYSESSGDQGADRRLEAFARHTHGMHFATTYKGQRASAPGKYDSNVTDTDLHGRKAKHPWEPDRKKGGGDVVRLLHKSLHERGFANVKLRARKSGEVDKARVRIDLDRCSQDPPLYPVDCEVKV
jgi:hypothetical protein